MSDLIFTGSSPDGYKVEIRRAVDGYSLFLTHELAGYECARKEEHGLTYDEAIKAAVDWLNPLGE